MTISNELKAEILAIPGDDDGFWKSSSEETFLEIAEFLNEKGLSDGEIEYVLSELYMATANCFGG